MFKKYNMCVCICAAALLSGCAAGEGSSLTKWVFNSETMEFRGKLKTMSDNFATDTKHSKKENYGKDSKILHNKEKTTGDKGYRFSKEKRSSKEDKEERITKQKQQQKNK